MFLTRLALSDFRNYRSLTWRPAAPIAAISGPNGSGKTNLLEAVSLLVPGRGLRAARGAELPRHGTHGWAVAGRFATPSGPVDIGTGTTPAGPASEGSPDRRVFRLDGAPVRTQAEIAARAAALWLTPQMDRLFIEGAGGRRRFLDRLVWALEPSHARAVAAHDSAVSQRNRLLAQGPRDPAWLAGLEDAIARHAVAITAARLDLAARLNATATRGAAFPAAQIGVLCPLAEQLAQTTALATEDWARGALTASRARDAAAGSTAIGAHRGDMVLTDAASGLAAAQASTGQQKALLIGVILAHAAVIADIRGFAPLLLLDEPAVHLDAGRREALFAALARLPAQTLMTGTDAETFRPLGDHAEHLSTGAGALHPSRGIA